MTHKTHATRIDDLIQQHCPDGVEFLAFTDVGTFTRGGGPQKKDFIDHGVGCIHYGQIYTHYGVHAEFANAFVSQEVAARSRLAHPGDVIIADTSENDEDLAKSVAWLGDEPVAVSNHTLIYTSELNPKFVSYYLRSAQFDREKRRYIMGTKVRTISGSAFSKLRIPVPPLPVQEEIVRILDTFTQLEAELEAELEARKQQYEHYRAELLVVPDDSNWSTLGELCTIETGKLNANAARENGEYAFFTTAQEVSRIDSYRWDAEALLVAGNANVGDVKHYVGKFDAYQRTYVLTNFSDHVDVKFLFYVLKNGLQRYLEGRTNSAAMTYIVLGTLRDLPVALISLEEQRRIVEVLDRFDALVNDLSVGLPAELAARRKQYEYYRDRLLTFGEAAA